MSETVIFAIGAVIFAITVYGTVMLGGIALTERQQSDDDGLGPADRRDGGPGSGPSI